MPSSTSTPTVKGNLAASPVHRKRSLCLRRQPLQRTPQTETASFQGLSFTQLKELLAQTEDEIADRRVEELKVLADGYAK